MIPREDDSLCWELRLSLSIRSRKSGWRVQSVRLLEILFVITPQPLSARLSLNASLDLQKVTHRQSIQAQLFCLSR
jgi:hypothetical protein